MNANLFRLVFSSARGMWIPVWEGARARCAGGRGGARRKTKHAVLQVGAGTLLLLVSAAYAELPMPCGGGICGTSTLPNVPFASSGRADFSSDGINALIQQHDKRVILNWQSFNIGAGNSVEFKQPDAGSAALNHIWQGDASRIAGKLNANGQVYLINQNGILFDKGAQVNVHSLIASSLNIDDEIFNSGSLFSQVDDSRPGDLKHALAGDDASGSIVVNVDASLTAQSGGKITLFAPTIENSGTIQAPDGQVILAAGKKVYLQGSQDISLRGLLVEVDGGGTVTNAAGTGTIIAERGNITLMGLAVNQLGRVSATTSVRANGSIRLLARDTPLLTIKGMKAQHTGQVLLGQGGTTQIMPEVNDSATIDGNVTFNPSFVEIMGKTVRHEGDIIAPGGDVTLRALENPLFDLSPNSVPERSDSRVYLSETSRIDVSGTEEVELPMSRNQLEVELRGDELKDYPLQRNGVLRGEKVIIDVRKGTPVADVSKHLKTIPRTVAEKTVVGGTVNIESQGGDAVMRPGSVIDVSGGEVRYLGGVINTTKLIAQGKVYDISVAPADLVYDGILGEFTRHSAKWGVTESWVSVGGSGEFVPGYSEGKDAGEVSFKAYGLALDGSLRGSATAGRYQRETGKIPLGGKLVVGDYPVQPNEQLDAVRDAVFQIAPVFSALGMDDALTQNLVMSTDFITQGGFSRIDMTRGGRITVPIALELPAGGEIRLSAGELDIGADISAPAGKITLNAGQDLKVSPDSVISARGLWVNDLPQAGGEGAGSTLINGGMVTLSSAGALTLGEIDTGVVNPMTIDVSGGGWLNARGNLKKGNGGDINIKSGGTLLLGAVLQGHALGKGGTLTLSANKVLIKEGVPLSTPSGLTLDAADVSQDISQFGLLVIPSWMFSKLGFTKYEINTNAYGSHLTIASGTSLTLQAPYLELGADYGMRASGANLWDFSRLEIFPERRSPVSLSLNHNAEAQADSRLSLEVGARIEADPGASVLLNTKIGMVIDGEINAPAGTIGLKLQSAGDKLDFLPEQAIWLGAQSRLLATGAVQLQPDAQGLRRGEVLAGGRVSIETERGYIVAEAGAVIDVSGTQTHLDLPVETGGIHRESTQVVSSAGTINLTAAEGMLLDAALLGKAGEGAPAAGGALSLRLTTSKRAEPFGGAFPSGNRQIVLHARGGVLTSQEGVVRGAAIPDALNGQAFLNTETLAQGGFERFSAQSDHEIRFQGDVDIALKRSVVLDAPALNLLDNKVNVSARYVALGSSDQNYQSAPPATGGTGQLNVSADLIDLIGNSALHGVKETNLHSRGDLRLRGVVDTATSRLMGSLSVTDNLNLQARQVYPTTLSEFEIKSSDGTVRILSATNPDANSDSSPAPVLSAGGKLTVSAPRIENHGALKAPLGEIALNGSGDAGQIVLGAGSQTSVSAEGLVIPYGKTQNGKDWVYGVGTGLTRVIDTPPQKNLRLTAANIDLRAGAEINLSGNGDLYAYEFVPGPGGSTDVLENTVNGKINTSYAILPALGVAFAPYDPQYYNGSTLVPGESLYLSGAEGLAAGFYTLLPSRYALLPGAYLVTARNGYQDILPGQNISLTDGSQIVAGKHAAGTDILDSRWSGFSVSPGVVARTQAEYQDRYANTFFTEQARANDVLALLLPSDAGRMIIAAGQTLTLDATLQASHVAGGRGAAVDISATQLAVVTPQTAAEHAGNGFVTLDAASLTRLGAESLLLGGTRKLTEKGDEIQVSSAKVIVANDAAHALAAPEIILVANDQVQVQAGSVIEGVGDVAGKHEKITLGSVENSVDGDGALLRVASGERLEIVRHNTDRASGTLDVESGTLLSGTAVELDATQTNTFNGRLNLKEKGSLSLGAGLISIGETASVTEGLVFSPEQLAALNTVGNITLRSYSTVDFWGDVTLGGVDGSGNPLLSKLFVEAGGINGYANAGKTASINAGEFSFANPGNIVASNVVGGGGLGTQATQGTLVVTAQDIMLGEGNKTLSGFDHVKITARNEITAQGTGKLEVPGTLVLEATRLGATKRADQTYTAAGDVTIVKPAQPANLPAASALAAQLAITGASIHHAGQIDLPSGKVTLTARTGDVVLTNGAQITTQGVIKTFDDVAVSSPAGKVSLVSDQGNIEIQHGALVDVSGIGSSGDAGTLSISAIQGKASLQGQIKGGVVDNGTGQQGRFVLDANVMNNDSIRNSNDFTALNQKLNEGQFNSERTIRLRGNDKFDVDGNLVTDVNGDVLIEANGNGVDNTVKAHTFRLTADNGKIDVLGSIDASGEQGGAITLSARDDVTLHGGSVLDARATGAKSRGGQVELVTTAGLIDVQDQSAIDVSGDVSGNALGGHVRLRALATVSDVNIAAIAGTIKGASDVTVEAVKVYQYQTDTIIDSSLMSTWQSELSMFMDTANIDAIKTRLGKASDSVFHVVPGLEVQSAQTLTLASDWDLSGWRFGSTNEPGVLTLRAADSLTLDATLSDGFAGTAPDSLLQADRSWSYRLVGGADLKSADTLVLLPAGQLADGSGDVVVAAGKLVRTGSGAIDIAAGGNFELGKDASGINQSTAVVYTAGQSSAGLADFTPPALTGANPKGSANYPTGGGDIRIQAGKDIKGAITHQLITEWLQRQGQTNGRDGMLISNRNPSWWVNFSKFQQNIGALGGGNVSVTAGNSIDNLSVVIPTTGRLAGAANTQPLAENLIVTGGGDMRIEAGGDIRSGIYYVGKGLGTIRAGGSLEAGRKVSDTNPVAPALLGSPVHAIFALGDGKIDVRAGGDITVETVINPTVVAQESSIFTRDTQNTHPRTYFFTYAPDSAAEFTSLAGDATFVNDVEAVKYSVAKVSSRNGIRFLTGATDDSGALGVYPGSFAACALEGDVFVKNKITLFPSASGNLQLLAAGDVDVQAITLSDADPALLLNPLYIPVTGTSINNRSVFYNDTRERLADVGFNPRLNHAAIPVHAQDNEPVRVVAKSGNINGEFRLSKKTRLIAGKDIRNIVFNGQHVRESDVTLLQAGRDIFFDTPRDLTTGAQGINGGGIYLGGPGRLEVRAGRNVNLGSSNGIVSRGNLDNPNLPTQGADVTVMAGIAEVTGYEGFIDKYFNSKNQLTVQDYKNSDELTEYIKEKLKIDNSVVNLSDAEALQEFNRQVTAKYAQELTQYMREINPSQTLTQDEALTAFKALTPEQQWPFVSKAFYSELRDAGREYSKVGKSGYARGFEAIATLFPDAKATGDLSLLFSQIKTEAGGDINIFVPDGKVNAGQTTPPAESGSSKTADQLGIIAQSTGAVRAFVKDDFAVNESRIFTLGGGDILMWSSEGDIDAGKGAKTAVSAPAPVPITDKNGITTFKFLSVAGSGIRSILVDKDTQPGDVDLIAPNGEVNAGDAGIGAAGNLNIAALRVVGADNIQVGGISTGVPVADTGGLGGSLSGVSNLGGESKVADQVTQDMTNQATNSLKDTFKPSFLTVEVIGHGD